MDLKEKKNFYRRLTNAELFLYTMLYNSKTETLWFGRHMILFKALKSFFNEIPHSEISKFENHFDLDLIHKYNTTGFFEDLNRFCINLPMYESNEDSLKAETRNMLLYSLMQFSDPFFEEKGFYVKDSLPLDIINEKGREYVIDKYRKLLHKDIHFLYFDNGFVHFHFDTIAVRTDDENGFIYTIEKFKSGKTKEKINPVKLKNEQEVNNHNEDFKKIFFENYFEYLEPSVIHQLAKTNYDIIKSNDDFEDIKELIDLNFSG
ncbi:MAG: hypothetical protein CL760_11230 [Chloroflexi bacterium]|nr:hypothetical protein [Chloroflexota bacterium]|tara:strand:+ start:1167 stop:1952 length:786 start_codon:yes stop_codon:yes gene_type:complete